MDKNAIALVLDEIGTLLELHGENAFKVRAFQAAARAIERTEEDVARLVQRGALESIPGVGPATARVIRELVQTGTSRYYQDLRSRTPSGFYELLSVPRLGAKRIRILHEKLGIESVADLERAARAGEIAKLPGFGEKTQEMLLQGVGYVRTNLGRRRLADALEIGPRLLAFVQSLPGVHAADIAGELRRRMETVDGIDIVAAVPDAQRAQVLSLFAALPGTTEAAVVDEERAHARLSDGFRLRLRCVPVEQYGFAVLEETGSAAHLDALRAYFEHAPDRDARDERALYESAGLQYVEPELRESGDEVAMAAEHGLPQLVRLEDLRGCFHCHTIYSDGRNTVAEMAEAARKRGWRYLGIADHSRNAGYAGGLSRDDILRQQEEIDAWNEINGAKLWVFKGIEADILADGRLDYEDEPDILESFDFVIGSIHSSFQLRPDVMTARLIRALQHPALTFLGHPTGRLLLSRAGYQFDVDAVLATAAENGVAVEINADPHRLDLDWRYWRRAREMGVRCAINPDAHSVRALGVVEYGVYMARKGWLSAGDVVNTWTLPAVRKFLRQRKTA